jgi:hypothetical protein
MSRRVPLARRRPSFTPESRADQMLLGEKALEVLMGSAYVAHAYSLVAQDSFYHGGMKDTKVKITKLERKSFFVLFVSRSKMPSR